MKYIKAIIVFLLALVSSQCLNYYVIDEILIRFVNPSIVISLGTRLIIFMIIISLLSCLFFPSMEKKKEKLFTVLGVVYLIGLLAATFRSNTVTRSMNLEVGKTIIGMLNTKNAVLIISNIGVNILIPIGLPISLYLLNMKKLSINLICSIGIFIGLEFIQLITGRGIFDVDDIILTTIGVVIGIIFLHVTKFVSQSNPTV